MEENNGAAEMSGENGRESEAGNSVRVSVNEQGTANEEGNCVGGFTLSGDICRDLSANRWPKQETMALLRIRSEMDVEFKGTGRKSLLWEEISRKMAALGYCRSANKCKEKFENIFKYHKRRKSTSSRSAVKSYRFSYELDALDHHQNSLRTSGGDTAIAASPISSNPPCYPQMATPVSVNYESSHFTTSTSATFCSGSESEGTRNKKRKWANLFDKMLTAVLEKQEQLQNKFLEAIDKCELERLAREEAWKMQELDRMKRQHELLIQERAISEAKDAAIMAFLQKIAEKGKFSGTSLQPDENQGQETSIACRQDKNQGQERIILCRKDENQEQETSLVCRKEKYDGENSSSRWPKEEVEALIRIKTKLESEHQRLGPLWEDIALAMKNIGYDRGAKKCKEKWENINKYYRKVKESNRQRRSDSKTCPYFHLLDSVYNTKTNTRKGRVENSSPELKHGELLLHMMNSHSEQQLQHNLAVFEQQQQQGVVVTNGVPSQNGHTNYHDDETNNQ